MQRYRDCAQKVSADPERRMIRSSEICNSTAGSRLSTEKLPATMISAMIPPLGPVPSQSGIRYSTTWPMRLRRAGKLSAFFPRAPPIHDKQVEENPEYDRARTMPDRIHQDRFVDAKPIRHSDHYNIAI